MESYTPAAVERAMKVQEVILRAMAGTMKWLEAAEVLGIKPRTMRRWYCLTLRCRSSCSTVSTLNASSVLRAFDTNCRAVASGQPRATSRLITVCGFVPCASCRAVDSDSSLSDLPAVGIWSAMVFSSPIQLKLYVIFFTKGKGWRMRGYPGSQRHSRRMTKP